MEETTQEKKTETVSEETESAAAVETEAPADSAESTPENDWQKKYEETYDQYQRVLAEYANYKRRTDQEKEKLGAFVKGEVLKALLPAVDNLERAVASPDGEEYRKGVEMVIRQFEESLVTLGLEEIEALGATFDPELHHAVMREDADGVEPETVTEVYQKGYRIAGRVLRPAMVKVAN